MFPANHRLILIEPHRNKTIDTAFLCAIFSFFAPHSLAEITSVRDPTTPPPEWLAAMPQTKGGVTQENTGNPPVQLVVLGKTRRFAVIDGKLIKIGDGIDDSQVVDIRSNKIFLADEKKSLNVLQNIEKTNPGSTIRKKSVEISGDNAATISKE